MSPRRDTLAQNIDNSTPVLTFCMLQIRYPVLCHYPQHNVPYFWHLFMCPLSYRLLLLCCRIRGLATRDLLLLTPLVALHQPQRTGTNVGGRPCSGAYVVFNIQLLDVWTNIQWKVFSILPSCQSSGRTNNAVRLFREREHNNLKYKFVFTNTTTAHTWIWFYFNTAF